MVDGYLQWAWWEGSWGVWRHVRRAMAGWHRALRGVQG